jgi:hypothetical protein
VLPPFLLHTAMRKVPMLTAAVNLQLLPATLFFGAFSTPRKPAEIIPLIPAKLIRHERKALRLKGKRLRVVLCTPPSH